MNQASLSARMSRSGLAAWLSDTYRLCLPGRGTPEPAVRNFAVSGLHRQSPSSCSGETRKSLAELIQVYHYL